MRAVLQRVTEARVTVAGQVIGEIGPGLLILLGVASGDTPETAAQLLDKCLGLRIFSDAEGKFNHSARELGRELLVVSQFTLLADTRRGRRPSFTEAAPPALARELYEHFVALARGTGLRVATGEFAADMQVSLTNDGPVTICLDSK
jgi:D-aminoacyl-tRNA deacylase